MNLDTSTTTPASTGAQDAPAQEWAARALEHCRFLCQEIGPRPSAGEGEREASDYALQVLEGASLLARRELILSQRSAYKPFSLAIGTALLAHLVAGRSLARRLLSAALGTAGAIAFAREADLSPNWTHEILKPGDSQNIVAVIRARGERKRRVVLCAHLDSHRTPIFYSHPLWLKVFSPIIALTFVSMALDAVRHLLARPASSAIGRLHIGLQLASLALTLQADTTPHTEGANDNASGAGVVLALAERLALEPLDGCEVWVALLGCEEVGAHGMRGLLRRHGKSLSDALFLNFDMVGIGTPTVVQSEGLLRKISCDPHLRAMAFQVAQEEPNLLAGEHAGLAYTDASVARQNGLAAITIDSLSPQGSEAHQRGNYWHQVEDTFDKIEPQCLGRALELGWKMLQRIDKQN